MNEENQAVILVVDDIPTNTLLIKTLLKGRNYEVLCAHSGAQALQIAEERKPELVLLDIMMPEMDGYEVLARLRSSESTKDIKVVMLSAISNKADIDKAMEIGADDYLVKPILAPKLYEAITRILTK